MNQDNEETRMQRHDYDSPFEEEQKMPYITTAERIGIEKGRKEGREEGREEGKLIGEILLAQQILNLTIHAEEELKGKTIEELESIVEQFKAKLNLTDGDPSS